MNLTRRVSISLSLGILVSIVPIQTHKTSAVVTSTTTRGVYTLVDLDPENNARRFGDNRMDLRIVRNEAFDSLANATKIIAAVTDGDYGGEYNGSSGCALLEGNLWCWGTNLSGRLGDGTTNSSPTPKLILSGVKDVFSSTRHTCALKNNGDLVCAGGAGEYMSGILTTFSAPIANNVQAINDGGWPCITKTDGRLFCAGNFRRSAGFSDRFVPTDWTWEDTGLFASGEVVNARIEPGYRGPGGFSAWDDKRNVCAVYLGQVSCVQMDPHTRESSIPTFANPIAVPGASGVSDIFMKTGSFGSSEGWMYAYSEGLLYKSDRSVNYGIPSAFLPVGSMEKPLGIISTPLGTTSISTGFVHESGIGTLDFRPVTKFSTSTQDVAQNVVRITAQTNLFQIIPMEVSTQPRVKRDSVRLRVTAGGEPVIGARIRWTNADLGSSTEAPNEVGSTTDINGWIDLPTINTGPITFEIIGGVSGNSYLNKASTLVLVANSGDILASIAAPPPTAEHTITVTNEVGDPVPSAVVTMSNLFRTNRTTATNFGSASWATSKPVENYVFSPLCPKCFAPQITLITGEDGKITFTLFKHTQLWPIFTPPPDMKLLGWGDFVASYNDGVVDLSSIGTISGESQTIKLPLQRGVSLTSAREVTASSKQGATISINGTSTAVVTEEICDVLVTGGLWSASQRFNQRTCSNGSIKKLAMGSAPKRILSCSTPSTRKAKNRVTVCPKKSAYLRLRIPGKAGTKGVCVVVAKKPCVTKQSVRYGVPKVLQVGRSLGISVLVKNKKGTVVTTSVTKLSKSRCEIRGNRVLAKKVVGDCMITVSARTKNRVVVYDIPVLIVR